MTLQLRTDFGMRPKMLNRHTIGLRLALEHSVICWLGLGCVIQ